MSGDFRLRDAAVYEKYYGAETPAPRVARKHVRLRLPRAQPRRDQAGEVRRVAGLLRDDDRARRCCRSPRPACSITPSIHVQGITGSSGSGIAPQAGTHHPSRANNLKTYKPLDHQHVPEIVQTLGDAGAKHVELRFVPVSAPLTRGIFATCFLELPADAIDAAKLGAMFDERYAREPFVRRPGNKRLPEVVAVHGSNYAEVGFTVGAAVDGKRTVALFSALDNLIKGGAGQAIQNMNLVLGVDEKASLADTGNWP